MGILNRLFKVGESKANKAVSKLEESDPVATIGQIIIDLEEKKKAAVKSKGTLRAREIQLEKDLDVIKDNITEWVGKAKQLHESMTDDNAETIKPLIIKALQTKKELEAKLVIAEKKEKKQEAIVKQITDRVDEFSKAISDAKDQLEELESRNEAAEAHKDIAEQLGDNGGTGSAKEMLDRMSKTVTEKEAYAEALDDLDKTDASLEDEIAAALGKSSNADDKLFADFENELK